MSPWFPIDTGRLLLREFTAVDEDDIHEYASDPEVVRFTFWGPNNRETTAKVLRHVLEQQKQWPRDNVNLAIHLKAAAQVIGSIRLGIVDEDNRTADFGYVVHRRYWNQGYATEATRAIIDVGFRQLHLHRVWATCDILNHGSYRVMEKVGMRREALFRKDLLQKERWRDSYLYAVLAEEWPTKP